MLEEDIITRTGWSGDSQEQGPVRQASHSAGELAHPLNPHSMFVGAGELQALQDILKTGDNTQLIKALSTIFEMCVNSLENQKAVADVGMIEFVLPILERWDRPDLQVDLNHEY